MPGDLSNPCPIYTRVGLQDGSQRKGFQVIRVGTDIRQDGCALNIQPLVNMGFHISMDLSIVHLRKHDLMGSRCLHDNQLKRNGLEGHHDIRWDNDTLHDYRQHNILRCERMGWKQHKG